MKKKKRRVDESRVKITLHSLPVEIHAACNIARGDVPLAEWITRLMVKALPKEQRPYLLSLIRQAGRPRKKKPADC